MLQFSHPFSADALDRRYVELVTSAEYPDAGEGLVANVDVPDNLIFCLMSGLIYDEREESRKQNELWAWAAERNLTIEDDEAAVFWKYSLVAFTL